jgi:hypothetical protein
MGLGNRYRFLAGATAILVFLAGCADAPVCRTGLKQMTAAEFYFGLAIPGGGVVSESDWQRFVDEEITPRFPDGLTITDASGQWKGVTGIVHERSKRLFVVLPDAASAAAKLEAVRAAYRTRFRQDSVLIVETPVCGAF